MATVEDTKINEDETVEEMPPIPDTGIDITLDGAEGNDVTEEVVDNIQAAASRESAMFEDAPLVDDKEEFIIDQSFSVENENEFIEDAMNERGSGSILSLQELNVDNTYSELLENADILQMDVQIPDILNLASDKVDDSKEKAEEHSDKQLTVEDILPAKSAQVVKAQKERPVTMEGICQPAEILYKAASLVSRYPTGSSDCQSSALGISVRGAKDVSNRQGVEILRRDIQERRNKCRNQWEPNPACTIPMRVKDCGQRSRVKIKAAEEWMVWEERDKERRDHELAIELGYETLVGNILYIDIPGGRDINRSWHSFLSDDVMEWGFPYKKGSIERPRMRLPEPYLAHQVKEKLWKYPRSRALQTTQEE